MAKTPKKTKAFASSGRRQDRRLIFGAFVALMLVFGLLLLRMFLNTTPSTPQSPVVEQPPRQLREVTLYFASNDGTRLVAEGREIVDCLDENDCLKATVQALINGPVTDLAPVLPPQTVLHSLSASESTLNVDFGNGLIAGHPGGTQSELLTVYALVDTLVVNFPHLRQVRFLVDGQSIETIKGHVDLRQPVAADFTWIEEEVFPSGNLRQLEVGGNE